jgi:hypothetical protein
MSRRALVAACMALLSSTGLSPVGAMVLCVSDDGCVEMEAAVGWSQQCPEASCDRPHRDGIGDAQHACFDVPVLLSALPSSSLELQAAPPALASVAWQIAPPIAALPPMPIAHRAPIAPPHLRSVVLIV